jgi:hypothetical protein
MRLDAFSRADEAVRREQVEWRVRETETGAYPPDYAMEPDLSRLSVDRDELGGVPSELPHFQQPNLQAELYLRNDPYPFLNDRRFLFVGAGAASVMLGSYLTMRGAQPENMTFVDRLPFGGIWNHGSTQAVGFNNPDFLTFNSDHGQDASNRRGENMRNFIQGVADDYLQPARFEPGFLVGLQKERGAREWTGVTEYDREIGADMVVMAAGKTIPRPFSSCRFFCNLDKAESARQHDIIVERSQRRLTDEEIGSGRPFVFIGLGNSTAAMMHQIQVYEDIHNTEIEYVVVTDNPSEAIDFPDQVARGKDRPLFREPDRNYLTGYAADRPRERRCFIRAREEGKILTDLTEVFYNDTYRELHIIRRGYAPSTYFTRPHDFALIGAERDNTLFESIGAMRSVAAEEGTPDIRVSDGAVGTEWDRYMSNVFAIGSVASTRRYPSRTVIPGIFGQIPATALTMGIRAYAGV